MSEAERENLLDEEADRAMARRLGRLRGMPVDMSGLEARVTAAIPRARGGVRGWVSPLRAVAALLVLAVTVVGVILATSGGPVMASAAEMAKFHEDLVSNRVAVMKVDSLEEAEKALAAQGSGPADLPQMPQAHAMACCMKSIKDRKVACVLLKSEGRPITLSVAKAAEMLMPVGEATTRGGIVYYKQSYGTINMVSFQKEGHFVCLIGDVAMERLMDLGGQLRF